MCENGTKKRVKSMHCRH